MRVGFTLRGLFARYAKLGILAAEDSPAGYVIISLNTSYVTINLPTGYVNINLPLRLF